MATLDYGDDCPSVAALASKCAADWPTIAKAQADAKQERNRLGERIRTTEGMLPVDTSVVVFGSLARGEWTQGSDRDWTLLIDGPVDVKHADVASRLAPIFEEGEKKPGPTGVFGWLAFSNQIVHFIGGDDDTNTNTTRRILLLLESRSLYSDDPVRPRVLGALLDRYVGEDLLYHQPDKFRIPRFLLNDYVRYWRMMAVDSAQKRRERSYRWALRNIKLRLSRKLIFAAGLWACLSCDLHPSPELQEARTQSDRDQVGIEMTSFLLRFSEQPPLETVSSAFLKYEAWDAARRSMNAYEDFVKILNDKTLRDELQDLKHFDAISNPTFARGKLAALDFQEGLTELFFRTDEKLSLTTGVDGVF